MTLSICCLDNQIKWCMILLVSCFNTAQGRDGCVPWIEPLSRGAGGLLQMCTAWAHLYTDAGQGTITLGKPKRAGSIKLHELTSCFMICTERIKLGVLLVGICINKLREHRSSVGKKSSVCTIRFVNVIRTLSVVRLWMCGFDWPVILHFVVEFHGWVPGCVKWYTSMQGI